MKPLTLFTWGYWGWGNATEQLVKAVDAVERARGYRPPMFLDVRISRSVRAPGFNGKVFEQTVGKKRYRWMPDLGNVAVKTGGRTRIKNPAAAEALLDLAQECAPERRRVLFFCSCEFPRDPRWGGCCHRTMVADLVLRAARRRRRAAQIVEWPGDEPSRREIAVAVSAKDFAAVQRRRAAVPVGTPPRLSQIAGLPWGSVVRLMKTAGDSQEVVSVLSGPARYSRGQWQLPNFGVLDAGAAASAVERASRRLRKDRGLEEQRIGV